MFRNGWCRLNRIFVMNTSHIHGNTFCLGCKRASRLILIRSCFSIIRIGSINNIGFHCFQILITKPQRLHIARFCTYTNDIIERKQLFQNFCSFCCSNIQCDTLFPTIQVIEIQTIAIFDRFPAPYFVPAIWSFHLCYFRAIR